MKIALVNTSDYTKDSVRVSQSIVKVLSDMGIEVSIPEYLKHNILEHTSILELANIKANALMQAFEDTTIDYICDISGGDTSNEVLSLLDYHTIERSKAVYMGYSDLTVIVNSIYAKTNRTSYLYSITNLLKKDRTLQIQRFKDYVLNQKEDLFNVEYKYIYGSNMSGTLIGGNVRCFSKLLGTPYLPNLKDKLLFLEARSGGAYQMISLLNQYKQAKVFDMVNGVVLGTFTAMETSCEVPTIEDIVLSIVPKAVPIAKTVQVEHGSNSKALKIGTYYDI